MSRRPRTWDDRDPRVPLEKPPFGEPAWARLCPKCQLWYPWAAFYKKLTGDPTNPRNGGKRGSSHYVRCLVCRTADGIKPRKKRTERRLPQTSPRDDFLIAVLKERART